MSLLLPQTRAATVRAATPISIHGDRYIDVSVTLEGDGALASGRIGATECPADLFPGDRVEVRFTMGVMVRVTRPAA